MSRILIQIVLIGKYWKILLLIAIVCRGRLFDRIIFHENLFNCHSFSSEWGHMRIEIKYDILKSEYAQIALLQSKMGLFTA